MCPLKISKNFNSGIPFGLTIKLDGTLITSVSRDIFLANLSVLPSLQNDVVLPFRRLIENFNYFVGVNYKFLKIFVLKKKPLGELAFTPSQWGWPSSRP
jgi:hypothetical protein